MRESGRNMGAQTRLDWSPYSTGRPAETLAVQRRKAELSLAAACLREDVMRMMLKSRYGHPASCLGLAELFAALYAGGILNFSARRPLNPARDRLVVSCGHVSALVYTALASAGFIASEKLEKYACRGGLPGHLERFHPAGVEISAGSLGQGVSTAVGMALALKETGRRVFLLTSDGEQQEGQVWEAYMAVRKYHLPNLLIFVDVNGLQNSGTTAEIMPVGSLVKKYRAFGLPAVEQDGHDAPGIVRAAETMLESGGLGVILLRTVPGKGVSFMENNPVWHGDLPEGALAEQACRELEKRRREAESWKFFLEQMV